MGWCVPGLVFCKWKHSWGTISTIGPWSPNTEPPATEVSAEIFVLKQPMSGLSWDWFSGFYIGPRNNKENTSCHFDASPRLQTTGCNDKTLASLVETGIRIIGHKKKEIVKWHWRLVAVNCLICKMMIFSYLHFIKYTCKIFVLFYWMKIDLNTIKYLFPCHFFPYLTTINFVKITFRSVSFFYCFYYIYW